VNNVKYLIAVVFLSLQSTIAQATYDVSKVKDWKYHAFICKNVVIGLSMMIHMEEKYGKAEIEKQADTMEKSLQEIVLKNEKEYPFDQTDALFIADMVHSIRQGLEAGNFSFTSGVALNQGFDLCASTLDKFDKELSK